MHRSDSVARGPWLERAALIGCLVVAGAGWYSASTAHHRADRLEHQIETLQELQERYANSASAPQIPGADLFQPSGTPDSSRRHALEALSASDDPVVGARRRPIARGGGQLADPPSAPPAAVMGRTMLQQARKAGESPGAMVLDTLYQAADQLAIDEEWDALTYEDVTRVFDRTMMEANSVFERAQQGEITPAEARREAIQLRNKAINRLQDVIGSEGILALRDVVVDEVEAMRDGR